MSDSEVVDTDPVITDAAGKKKRPRGSMAMTFGYISIAAPLLLLALSGFAIMINNQTFSMDVVFLAIPFLVAVSIAAGLIAIVLALIARLRGENLLWKHAIALGLIGGLSMPVLGWVLASL